MHKLIDLAEKNVKHCPWCSEKTSEDYFKFLLDEVRELKAAFKNKDYGNAEKIGYKMHL
jgi:hypothetical protein